MKGATSLINPLGFLALIYIYRRLLLKWWKPLPDDDDAEAPVIINTDSQDIPMPTHKGIRCIFTIIIPLVSIVIGGIWFYSSITDAAGYFINPNYYALKDIIALVRDPSSF